VKPKENPERYSNRHFHQSAFFVFIAARKAVIWCLEILWYRSSYQLLWFFFQDHTFFWLYQRQINSFEFVYTVNKYKMVILKTLLSIRKYSMWGFTIIVSKPHNVMFFLGIANPKTAMRVIFNCLLRYCFKFLSRPKTLLSSFFLLSYNINFEWFQLWFCRWWKYFKTFTWNANSITQHKMFTALLKF